METTTSAKVASDGPLGELLAGYHPYWRDDPAEYATLVKAHAAKPPALLGSMPSAHNAELSAALHRCLSPDPAARPTADILHGIAGGARSKSAAPTPTVATAAVAAPRTAGEPLVSDVLELLGAGGRTLQLGVRTELGKALVRQFGPDGEFWDSHQCILERRAGRQWVVSPIEGTTNETLVNGWTLTAPLALHDGDRIAVGRQAKGLIKLPLTARGR